MSDEKTLAPTDLCDYLKSSGWSAVEAALKDRLYVFGNDRFPRRQLVYPMDSTVPDYAQAVARVFDKLAEMTGQRPDALAAAAQALGDDVLRFRVFSAGDDASLPLEFAATLVQSIEKLLKAAACSVLRPSTYHPRLALAQANQFVGKARFQQTRPGSFVLAVACPVDAMDVQTELDMGTDGAPFVRRVTQALHRSLSTLASAIETDTLTALVSELKGEKAPPISANLCEALCALHDETLDNALDIAFDWSARHALPQDMAATQNPIRFQRDYFPRVARLQQQLRTPQLQREDLFVGTVEQLDGALDDDGRRSGDVILALLLAEEGETVKARVSLSADDYAKADRAHMHSGAYIRVHGRLHPGRQPRQLTDVSRFELLDGD